MMYELIHIRVCAHGGRLQRLSLRERGGVREGGREGGSCIPGAPCIAYK